MRALEAALGRLGPEEQVGARALLARLKSRDVDAPLEDEHPEAEARWRLGLLKRKLELAGLSGQ